MTDTPDVDAFTRAFAESARLEQERRLAHQAWMDAWLVRFAEALARFEDDGRERVLYAEPDPRDGVRSAPPPSTGPAPISATLAALESDPRRVVERLTEPGRHRRRVALMGHLAGCASTFGDGRQCNCDVGLSAMGLHHLRCAAWSGDACNCAALRTTPS